MSETNEADADKGKDSVFSPRGLHITYYQLVSHALPGMLCLLMARPLLEEITEFPVDAPSWPQLIIIGIALLLFALPVGFLSSGFSFFTLGPVVFYLKYFILWRSRVSWISHFSWLRCLPLLFPHLTLNASLGRPQIIGRLGDKFPSPECWARFIGDIEFILRSQKYGGPRVDAPEWVLASAILSRTLAFLVLIATVLPVGNSYRTSFLVLGTALLLFTVLAELYRDYELLLSADHFTKFKSFVPSNVLLADMLSEAEKTLIPAGQEVSTGPSIPVIQTPDPLQRSAKPAAEG